MFFSWPDPRRAWKAVTRSVGVDDGGAVFNLDLQHPVSRYQATSDISQPGARELRRSDHDQADFDADYLELPALLDPRIPFLAGQITAQADNNYDKATAIESYLRTHYRYTLQLSRIVPHDPLAEFLFDRKQGHCEYFASSMAVMLRSLGIPSRIVNGFTDRGVQRPDIPIRGSRQRRSFLGRGISSRVMGGLLSIQLPGGTAAPRTGWSRMALYIDAMASFWRDWVVNYDASHQQALAVGARTGSRQLFSSGATGGAATMKVYWCPRAARRAARWRVRRYAGE